MAVYIWDGFCPNDQVGISNASSSFAKSFRRRAMDTAPGRCLARNRASVLSDTAEIRPFYGTCQAWPAGIWNDFVDRTRQHASNDRTRPVDCQAAMQ